MGMRKQENQHTNFKQQRREPMGCKQKQSQQKKKPASLKNEASRSKNQN